MRTPLNIVINTCNEPQAPRLIARICEQTAPGDRVLVLSYRSTADYLSMLNAMQAAYCNLAVIELNALSSLMDHRNFAKSYFPANSWIVYLDADEWVTDLFLQCVRETVEMPGCPDVVLLRRANMMHFGQARIPHLEWEGREVNYQAWPDLQARVLANTPPNIWQTEGIHEVIRFNEHQVCHRPQATIIHHKDQRSYANATYDKSKLPAVHLSIPDGFLRSPYRWDENVWHEVVTHNCYRMPVAFLPDDVVIDIGAHIGCFGYAAAKRGAGTVVCVEASEQNFAQLQKNLAPLGVKTVLAVVWPDKSARMKSSEFAAGDSESNTGGCCVVGCEDKDSAEIVTLDSLIERHGRVRFLKVDCEGAEYRILMDATRIEDIDEIALEYHPNAIGSTATVRELEIFFRSKGFFVIKQEVTDGFGYLWAINLNRR